MDKKPVDPVEQTKTMVRRVIAAAVGYNEEGQASAASQVTDHLIDELAAKLKAESEQEPPAVTVPENVTAEDIEMAIRAAARTLTRNARMRSRGLL